MKRYERMLEIINKMNNDDMFIRDLKNKSDVDLNDFKNSPVFIIDKFAPESFSNEFFNEYLNERNYSLPFKKILVVTKSKEESTGNICDAFILLEEKISYGETCICADYITVIGGKIQMYLSEDIGHVKQTELVMHFLANYAYSKKHKELGIVKNVNVKEKTQTKKKKKTINNLYIIGKNSNAIKMMGKSDRDIVWSKSWSCCGHWRKINETTIGKDRDGVYNVEGMTWVNECTKGSGELKNSIRVIK